MKTAVFESPLGEILLTSDGQALTGLDFREDAQARETVPDDPVLLESLRWLTDYFSGKQPDFLPPLHPAGTAFQLRVWTRLLSIPYGQVVSYGAIAAEIAMERGIPRMSAQAVGQAVGRNPIALMIPCHRVIGSGGALVGYAAGLNRKEALLRLEGSLS